MKLSVITVSYNASATIEQTIRSVAAQSHTSKEHIVIDGASTDDTKSILQRNAGLLANWTSERDSGLYEAMNKGIEASTGDYVGFLNADDLFASSDALSQINDTIERSAADVVFGNAVIVDSRELTRIRRYYSSASFSPWQLRFGNMPQHGTVYIRRSLLRELGGFRLDYSIAGDFELMVRVFIKARATYAHTPKTLTIQRTGGLSTRGFGSTLAINRQIRSALQRNGVFAPAPLPWARYALKIFQYVRKPDDYPTSSPALDSHSG